MLYIERSTWFSTLQTQNESSWTSYLHPLTFRLVIKCPFLLLDIFLFFRGLCSYTDNLLRITWGVSTVLHIVLCNSCWSVVWAVASKACRFVCPRNLAVCWNIRHKLSECCPRVGERRTVYAVCSSAQCTGSMVVVFCFGVVSLTFWQQQQQKLYQVCSLFECQKCSHTLFSSWRVHLHSGRGDVHSPMVTVSVHIHSENPDAVHVIQPRLAVAVVGFT